MAARKPAQPDFYALIERDRVQQIEAQLKRRKTRSHYAKGLRITDPVALECVKELAHLFLFFSAEDGH